MPSAPRKKKPDPDSFHVRPPLHASAVETAAALIEQRTEKTPGYPDLWNRLGLYHATLGRLDDAGTSFERALAINPRFLGALENRAWTAIALGDVYGWERFLDGPDYVRLHPGVRHHLLLFATARFESPERALVMSSMPPQGRYEDVHLLDRLWLFISLERHREAHHLVEDITCSDPALRGAFGCAGLLGTSVNEEAWQTWRAAYAFNPQLSEVCAHTSRTCQKGDELRESRAMVDWALSLSLDLPAFWVNLALHHEAAGESARALPCLERAVAANPQNRRARKELAMWLIARGRTREAVSHLEVLRELAPNYADVRFHLGVLYMEREDFDQAAEELTAALAANPRYTRAALVLARVRFEQQRWSEARAGYERVVADGHESCEILTALAEVYDRLGESDLAGETFARADALDSSDAQLLRARADWHERHGRSVEATADRVRLDDGLRQHDSSQEPTRPRKRAA